MTGTVIRASKDREILKASLFLIIVLLLSGYEHVVEPLHASNPKEPLFGTMAFVPDWSAAEEIDEIASHRFLERYWPRFRGNYEQGGRPAPTSNPSNEYDDVIVFVTPYTKPVLPDYLPNHHERSFTKITLFAAKGESEPFSLGVRTLRERREVSIEISDLRSRSNIISKLDITNRLVISYPAATYMGKGRYETMMRPMVLLKTPDNKWEFPPYTSHNYIVDIHVPTGAQPGTYHGRVTVKIGQKVARNFDLEIEVLPFELRTNNFHAGGFGVTYNIWNGGFFGYYPEMIEMDARYGHNMAGGFFNKGKEIPFSKNANGQLFVDSGNQKFRRFNHTMELLKKHGMGHVAFWNWGGSGKVNQFNDVLAAASVPPIHTDAGKTGFASICLAIKEAEKKYGWPEIVINPYDEALKNQDATREIIQAASYVRNLSPKTRLYMTEWREGHTRLYQSSGNSLRGKERPKGREYAALITSNEDPQLNFDVIGSNKLSLEARELQNQLGGEYWHYTAVTRMGPQIRFAYGFKPFIVNAEAVLIWATYKGGLDGKGWTLNYVMSDLRDGRKRRNTQGPVIASPRSLVAREGVDDRKYIETLRYYAVNKNSQNDLDYLKNLPERCRKLASLNNIGGIENTEAIVTNARKLQKMRIELKDRIVKLATNEKNVH